MKSVEWARRRDGLYILIPPADGWPKALKWSSLWFQTFNLWLTKLDMFDDRDAPNRYARISKSGNAWEVRAVNLEGNESVESVKFVKAIDALRWALIETGHA